MVWGSIPGRGVGDLVKIGGIMDKMVYHNILVTHTVPSGRPLIGDNFVFQKCNDPKQSSNYCENYLRRKEASGVLTVMNWLSQSPDLNPIEQFWELIDRKLDKSHVKIKETLWSEIKRSWETIRVEVLKNTLKLCQNVVELSLKPKVATRNIKF